MIKVGIIGFGVVGKRRKKYILNNRLHKLSKKFNDYIDTKIKITPYFEHI